jgi:hypothetical protein
MILYLKDPKNSTQKLLEMFWKLIRREQKIETSEKNKE